MKLDPDIFVGAAERLDDFENDYACTAIRGANSCHEDSTPYVDLFKMYFEPLPEEYEGSIWFGNPIIQRNRQVRIYALLLMAEIVRDLNKKKKKKKKK